MADIGNTGKEPQFSSEFLINIQPPTTTDASEVLARLHQGKAVGPTGTGRQTYYDDSVASSGTQQKDASTSTTNLDTMPPPDDVDSSTKSTTTTSTTESTAVAGPPGAGNPFLNANPLVAYFIDFNSIAVMLRELTNSQAHLLILQMGMVNETAHLEAQKILDAAHAESKMYLAAAITSFTEAGVSLATGLGSFAAESAADKQMESASKSKQTAVDDAQTNLQARKTELSAAQDSYNNTAATPKAQERLQNAQREADANPNDPESNQKLQDARDNLEAAKLADKDNQVIRDHKTNLEKAEQKVDEAQSQLNKAQRDHEEFKAKFLETRYSMSTSKTFRLQMAGEFIKKSTDGAANIVKSIETMEKGQAEALRALYQSYQQNSQRMIDSLNSSKSENSKMISELFQLLRKFSDDTRKLGGSLTAQSAS